MSARPAAGDGRADYAVRPATTAGRRYTEPETEAVDPFAVDRRRVLSSTAFRRLQFKTQVFLAGADDHFRTRLTHTLDVAELARRLAAALGTNQALAEVIALAHDLGHAPFGHAGERALAEMMADHGGFEHNLQSLRVVDYLEHPYPEFRGLNLAFEVREGLAKHTTTYDRPGGATHGAALDEFAEGGPSATVEAQVASMADRLAYNCHDLEDALGAEMIIEGDLADIALWRRIAGPIRDRHPDAHIGAIRRPILDAVAEAIIQDIADESRRRMDSAGVHCPDDARRLATACVACSNRGEAELSELEMLLLTKVYRHQKVASMDAGARAMLRGLFEAYLADLAGLPPRFAARVAEQGAHRVICDYIAGMTDRFCRNEYQKAAS